MEPMPGQSDTRLVRAPRETEYHGPVVVASMNLAGRTIKLVRPADPDQLLDDPQVVDWNRHDDYMPYWAYVWPAAYLLAETVGRERWPAMLVGSHATEALEIGCGLGLAGLVAVERGLRVQFTDYDPAPLDFVVRSAAENGFDPTRFSTRQLDWRNLPDEQHSIILGADVIYEARLVPVVAGLLACMLAPCGIGLIASPYRVAARGFPAALAERGLVCQAEAATARTEDGQLIKGTIYRVTRSALASAAIGPERADQRANVGNSGLVEPTGQISENAFRCGRIVERGRADLDGRGAGDQELEGVVGRGDAADADQGQSW
jgi:predicted nicotinamide N-methyase